MRRTAAIVLCLALTACRPRTDSPPAASPTGTPAGGALTEATIVPDIAKRLAQLAPVELQADLTPLAADDRRVLELLVEAARQMDQIFLRQAWAGNPALQQEMAGWTGPSAEAARAYFAVNYGPWDRLDESKPFVGDQAHPAGAGYYPEDLTKEELEAWLKAHPGDREAFTSNFTVIRRRGSAGVQQTAPATSPSPAGGRGDRGEGGSDLVAVPYSQEYKPYLDEAARLLREAAAATKNESLRRFLTLRADAFGSNDYYASDLAWMDLDAPVEVTIGPYETYEDGLNGYKAAFEAFVTVALPKESAELARYKERLPWLESNLPIPEALKNPSRGTESPIRVVDVHHTSGDTRAGVQTLAFNLPNDERVREAKGSKKVLLRNTMRAKYDRILLPIAERVLAADQVADVSFEAYFDEVLHHELSHGLGPGTITVDGRKTEVRLELKELFSTLEEAKADVMGVYNILALMGRNEMPVALRKSLEPTYVAGLFRSARFGVDEAHGQGVVAQFNYLLEKGALQVNADGRFRAVSDKFPGAIRDLLHDMLILQANGDYAGTKAFLEKYGKATPQLRAALGRLGDVPVDIRPIYLGDGAAK